MKITTETLPTVRRQWAERAKKVLANFQNDSLQIHYRLRCFLVFCSISLHDEFLRRIHGKKFQPGGIVATYTSNGPEVDAGEYIIPKSEKK